MHSTQLFSFKKKRKWLLCIHLHSWQQNDLSVFLFFSGISKPTIQTCVRVALFLSQFWCGAALMWYRTFWSKWCWCSFHLCTPQISGCTIASEVNAQLSPSSNSTRKYAARQKFGDAHAWHRATGRNCFCVGNIFIQIFGYQVGGAAVTRVCMLIKPPCMCWNEVFLGYSLWSTWFVSRIFLPWFTRLISKTCSKYLLVVGLVCEVNNFLLYVFSVSSVLF